ncbi:hypothetical protein L596_029518 [Steinernema carpocapsae]|uniref:Uncharacterized protein n=1 Tax=Steinernema carpocapsae TaxID=34508 RepID=A0A4U5LUW1_STECR|nr:hypothetical protein L596_029518 [Steinernema carpocapsae]
MAKCNRPTALLRKANFRSVLVSRSFAAGFAESKRADSCLPPGRLSGLRRRRQRRRSAFGVPGWDNLKCTCPLRHKNRFGGGEGGAVPRANALRTPTFTPLRVVEGALTPVSAAEEQQP